MYTEICMYILLTVIYIHTIATWKKIAYPNRIVRIFSNVTFITIARSPKRYRVNKDERSRETDNTTTIIIDEREIMWQGHYIQAPKSIRYRSSKAIGVVFYLRKKLRRRPSLSLSFIRVFSVHLSGASFGAKAFSHCSRKHGSFERSLNILLYMWWQNFLSVVKYRRDTIFSNI